MNRTLEAAMRLINELLTGLARLCAASNEPPPIQIFAAKKALDQSVQKLFDKLAEPKR